MPEGHEVDTDRLHEAIEQETENGGRFLKGIALSTALLAAFAAIAALKAWATANEAMIIRAEATRLQAHASDEWAFYRARGTKAAVYEANAATWEASDKAVSEWPTEKIAKYADEQVEKSAEADHLLHKHHRFANSVALFQVSIALGALAALTRFKDVLFGSIVLGGLGIGLLAMAFFG